jgi:peptidoglycan-associated lipoprotein
LQRNIHDLNAEIQNFSSQMDDLHKKANDLLTRRGEDRMLRKPSVWSVVLISLVAVFFISTGCAKKQVVKGEELASPTVEVRKEAPNPEPAKEVEKPKGEASQPAEVAPVEKPKEEAKIALKEESFGEAKSEQKPAFFDLVGLRIQFAFDDYNLSSQARENLEKIASWMSKNPAAKIRIQGHTCEIGTNEYNLALGEARANSAQKYLEVLGVKSGRISTISYGQERPLDAGHTEEARSRNRRDEFVETK